MCKGRGLLVSVSSEAIAFLIADEGVGDLALAVSAFDPSTNHIDGCAWVKDKFLSSGARESLFDKAKPWTRYTSDGASQFLRGFALDVPHQAGQFICHSTSSTAVGVNFHVEFDRQLDFSSSVSSSGSRFSFSWWSFSCALRWWSLCGLFGFDLRQ